MELRVTTFCHDLLNAIADTLILGVSSRYQDILEDLNFPPGTNNVDIMVKSISSSNKAWLTFTSFRL